MAQRWRDFTPTGDTTVVEAIEIGNRRDHSVCREAETTPCGRGLHRIVILQERAEGKRLSALPVVKRRRRQHAAALHIYVQNDRRGNEYRK